MDVIVSLVLLVGVLGLGISFLITSKLLPLHKTLLQVVSVIIIAMGVYWKGGVSVEKEWRSKLEAAEQRARAAESEARIANGQIKYVFQDKIHVVKEVQVVIQDRIGKAADSIDRDCKITEETVSILNDAARNSVGTKK